jgi:catalase
MSNVSNSEAYGVSIMRTLSFALALAATVAVGMPAFAADETSPDQLVDALNKVFGAHKGQRAAHTKGFCVKGNFTPTAEAPSYTKAPHFAAPVPVIGRFSMAGGNPEAADNGKEPARGLALHFDLGKGNTTDLVMISAPVFVAKTPEQFLTLLTTVATKDGEKIKAFFGANPESTRHAAWLAARPVPASYATVNYWGVHTFALTNAKGESRIIKWKVVPTGGEVGLTDDEAKAKGPDFYGAEFKERLAKGPATFDLTAILGQDGDALDDPTAHWPDDRKSVTLGTIAVTGLEEASVCDAGIFDPTNVVDGIEGPKNDTIYPMRSADYAVSFSRRAN